jgi:hypothetical protein
MMGIEMRRPERVVLAGDAGEKERWDGKFPIRFCHYSFERISSNTWIGEAEGRYGGDEMIAEL